MRTVGAYEAKTHLSRLLDEVASGNTIVITRHGVPVALLTPPPNASRPDLDQVVENWIAYRKQHNITLGGLSLREMIEEGRMS